MDKKPEARPASLEALQDASITWRYVAPPGVSLEMCQRPEYWSQVTRECSQRRVAGRPSWNRIEIIADDGSWEADLRILAVDAPAGRVFTRTIREWHEKKRPGRKASLPDGFRVEHITERGWRVVDDRGVVLISEVTIEQDAVDFAVAASAKREVAD